MIRYTNSTEQAILGSSASQDISCILQKWEARYTVHKSLVFTTLCKMDPVHTLLLITDPF
jgi:hypothetical protein